VVDLAVSSVLVREDVGIQQPVYYSNQTLYDTKKRYIKEGKVALALVSAFRKLKPYFQDHQVTVLIDQPLREILHKLELFMSLVKWAIELGEFRL